MKKYLLILISPIIIGSACSFAVLDKKIEPDDDWKSNNNKGSLVEDVDIILDNPQVDQLISSPLSIVGQARGTWYFEASFPVVLTDWNGKIIAEDYVATQENWMTEDFVPFESTLVFDAPVYNNAADDFVPNGFLILKKDNPSGLAKHDDSLKIRVRFADVSTNNLAWPIADFESRISKKPFGIYITPQTSPVWPEKFIGYHTGVDMEYDDVSDQEISVKAIADGVVVRSGWVGGYGGMIAIRHNIDNKDYIVIYGHLNPDKLPKVNQFVSVGDIVGILGQGYTNETDGERKHLHLAIYTGTDINVRGYVSNKSDLSQWVDPVKFLK